MHCQEYLLFLAINRKSSIQLFYHWTIQLLSSYLDLWFYCQIIQKNQLDHTNLLDHTNQLVYTNQLDQTNQLDHTNLLDNTSLLDHTNLLDHANLLDHTNYLRLLDDFVKMITGRSMTNF